MNQTSNVVISCTVMLCSLPVSASVVREDIPYQIFRDFGENKGVFQPGATDIPIHLTDGTLLGRLSQAPMPDFSPVITKGYATLFNPQYLVSVSHIPESPPVSFGYQQHRYSIVARNDHATLDYHTPRLNKLVTEVAPAVITTETGSDAVTDNPRYPIIYRVGSGRQYVKNQDGIFTQVSRSMVYLTGGTTGPLLADQKSQKYYGTAGNLTEPANGPLASYATPGDSGSPLFAFDTQTRQWVLIATQNTWSSLAGIYNSWTHMQSGFHDEIQAQDREQTIHRDASDKPLKWYFSREAGTGFLTDHNGYSVAMHGKKDTDLNAGKNRTFSGSGHLILRDDVDQGAGALTFTGDYRVSPATAQTWTGGGLDIAAGKTVRWQVNGIADDNLHKIGEGTLHINGTGINPGGLKTGNGTVLLDQQPDAQGQRRAFSRIELSSGRSRVKLMSDGQITGDAIHWGYQGGELDLNGHDMVFRRFNATDYGAVITNTAEQRARLTLLAQTDITDFTVHPFHYSRINLFDITPDTLYAVHNTYNGQVDYYLSAKRTDDKSYLWPSYYQESARNWEFISADKQAALAEMARRQNSRPYLHHGQITGNLNLIREAEKQSERALVFDGKIDITGEMKQTNGRLHFQGRPVIHARNGDTDPVSLIQPDWEKRAFRMGTLTLQDTAFTLGRHASLDTQIMADNASVVLGSSKTYIDTNDGEGKKTDVARGNPPQTRSEKSTFRGDIVAYNRSVIDIGGSFDGGLAISDSDLTVRSDNARIRYASLSHTPLLLAPESRARFTGSLNSDRDITVNNAGLTFESPAVYSAPDIRLRGDSARLLAFSGSELRADISLNDRAGMMLYGSDAAPPQWYGRLQAEAPAHTTLVRSHWHMNKSSDAGFLTLDNAQLTFDGTDFSTLTTDDLSVKNSRLQMKTDLKNADKLIIKKFVSGGNNTLAVNFLTLPQRDTVLSLPLVTAPAQTPDALFRAADIPVGFSRLLPQLTTTVSDGQKSWQLTGWQTVRNEQQQRPAASLLAASAEQFQAEANNLNKRMGELRHLSQDAGVWVRMTHSKGSAPQGYQDRYRLLQTGFDKQFRAADASQFAGITLTHTQSSADSRDYHGSSTAYGIGAYFSHVAESGFYADVIAKYLRHHNVASLRTVSSHNGSSHAAGSGEQAYRTGSVYLGAETGYRFALTPHTFAEPQAELIYGNISGHTLRWQMPGSAVSLTQARHQPLRARAGLVAGHTLADELYRITGRIGAHYETDLRNGARMTLRDTAAEWQTAGKRDRRMLLSAGINAELSDNSRISLEAERSFFGHYNVDHALNATFRYAF